MVNKKIDSENPQLEDTEGHAAVKRPAVKKPAHREADTEGHKVKRPAVKKPVRREADTEGHLRARV